MTKGNGKKMPSDDASTVPLSASDLTVNLDATLLTRQLAEQTQVDQTLLYTVSGTEAAPAPDQADAPTELGGPLAPTAQVAQALPAAPAPLGPGEFLHFGPGVPAPSTTGTGQAGAIWRGEAAPPAEPERRRFRRGWLLPILVLIIVLAILAWLRLSTPIAVTGATARAQLASVTCGATETIIGNLETNGEPGTVTYVWKRSDGTESADLQQHFTKGMKQATVSLMWTFSGQGSLQATATLVVLSSGTASASTTFGYLCK